MAQISWTKPAYTERMSSMRALATMFTLVSLSLLNLDVAMAAKSQKKQLACGGTFQNPPLRLKLLQILMPRLTDTPSVPLAPSLTSTLFLSLTLIHCGPYTATAPPTPV